MKTFCIFVAMKKLTSKMKMPNAHRKRKAQNPIAKEIIILERNNVRIGIFTNLLGALGGLGMQIPKGIHVDFPSYSTVNRAVRVVGDCYDIPTPVGIYTVTKDNLYRFVA
jgi:hypothetical protein